MNYKDIEITFKILKISFRKAFIRIFCNKIPLINYKNKIYKCKI